MELVGMMHGNDGMSGWMGGWMLLWMLVGLAVLVLIVVGTVWLVRTMSRTGSGSDADARRELDLRYARGHMTAAEYDECRDRISSK